MANELYEAAFIADIHVGNHRKFEGSWISGINARCNKILSVLNRVVTQCSADDLFILGDLFDTHNPSPQVLHRTIGALQGSQQNTILLVGNHDQASTEVYDNALAPFHCFSDAGFRVYDNGPQVLRASGGGQAIDFLMLPFTTKDSVAYLRDALEMYENRWLKTAYPVGLKPRLVICMHLGISDDTTPAYLQGAKDSIKLSDLSALCLRYRVDAVFAGNWHKHKRWNLSMDGVHSCTVIQIGALCPTGFDNPGFEGYGVLPILQFDGNLFRVRTDTDFSGPRFVVVNHVDELGEAIQKAQFYSCSLYVNWRVGNNVRDIPRHTATLLSAIDAGYVADGYVTTDLEPTKASLREKLGELHNQESIAEALAIFVRNMAVPAGVNPQEVLDRARTYLGVHQ